MPTKAHRAIKFIFMKSHLIHHTESINAFELISEELFIFYSAPMPMKNGQNVFFVAITTNRQQCSFFWVHPFLHQIHQITILAHNC